MIHKIHHETRTDLTTNESMIGEARELAGWNAESEALSVYQALEKLTESLEMHPGICLWHHELDAQAGEYLSFTRTDP